MRMFIWVVSSLISVSVFAMPVIPDTKKTPGDMCDEKDPDFSMLRYDEKIPWCLRNVTTAEKVAIYEAYGIPAKCRGNYTIDHFIPLSLGGNNSRQNLWPEHKSIKALRMNLEMELHVGMNHGQITQQAAIDAIAHAKLHPPKEAYSLVDTCDKGPKGRE